MNKEQLIATLQACFFGDKGAYNLILEKYQELEQENNKLKEKISLLNTTNEKNYNKYCDLLKEKQELRSWLEEQYQEYKETEDERGIVLTSYTIDKLIELEGGKND